MAKKKAARKPLEKPTKTKPKSTPPTPRAQQTKAKAASARAKSSGLTSRVRGHVTARTRRNQAKRDAKQ